MDCVRIVVDFVKRWKEWGAVGGKLTQSELCWLLMSEGVALQPVSVSHPDNALQAYCWML